MTQSTSPVQSDMLSKRNMLILTGFLLVLLGASAYIFGERVIAIAAVTFIVSSSIEMVFQGLRKKPLGHSWMVTPLILTLLLPVTIPLWMAGVAAGFGIFFGKMIFGGEGNNVFNPAAVGTLFVTISFPVQMTQEWLNPKTGEISTLTPIIQLRTTGVLEYDWMDLLLGQTSGGLGTTFRLGILAIGIILILLKIIDWRIPFSYLSSVFILTGVGYLWMPETFFNPLLSMMVGSLLFGAFFVATDPVTAPIKGKQKFVYGIGLGLITVVIRTFSAFPEALIFSVIIMNAVTPLLDNWNGSDVLHSEEGGDMG